MIFFTFLWHVKVKVWDLKVFEKIYKMEENRIHFGVDLYICFMFYVSFDDGVRK
jgi:hypothetical protein